MWPLYVYETAAVDVASICERDCCSRCGLYMCTRLLQPMWPLYVYGTNCSCSCDVASGLLQPMWSHFAYGTAAAVVVMWLHNVHVLQLQCDMASQCVQDGCSWNYDVVQQCVRDLGLLQLQL